MIISVLGLWHEQKKSVVEISKYLIIVCIIENHK
ncbi:hypothetical protein M080_7276, partial [Bacteroides fragilis str. 3397 T10]